ncbi:MAG: hypothetical protein ACT4QC_13335 [Planctomycetaceae bacterium]
MKVLASFVGLALALLYFPPPLSDSHTGSDSGVTLVSTALAPRDDPDNVEGQDPPVTDGVTDPPDEGPGEET